MKFAIVESGGKQYRAVEGGTIEVDRLPVKAGENVKLEQILLFADGENITVGTPFLKDFPVWTRVLEHFKGDKVTIFNYSPKKRIRVKTGHRQKYTRLSVEQFGGSEPEKKQEEPARKSRKTEAKAAEMEAAPVLTEPEETKKAAPKAEKPAKAPAKAAAKPAAKKTTTTKAAPKPAAKKPAAKPAEKKSAAKKPAKKE